MLLSWCVVRTPRILHGRTLDDLSHFKFVKLCPVTNGTRRVEESLYCSVQFNDAVPDSDSTVSNDWIIVNNEMERMWKETVVI
jgi:hypothetical protein